MLNPDFVKRLAFALRADPEVVFNALTDLVNERVSLLKAVDVEETCATDQVETTGGSNG